MNAQQVAAFIDPTNNETDVSLSAQIVVQTSLHIDFSSITWEYPDLD